MGKLIDYASEWYNELSIIEAELEEWKGNTPNETGRPN